MKVKKILSVGPMYKCLIIFPSRNSHPYTSGKYVERRTMRYTQYNIVTRRCRHLCVQKKSLPLCIQEHWMLQSTLQRKIVKVSSPFIFCPCTIYSCSSWMFRFFVYQLYGFFVLHDAFM